MIDQAMQTAINIQIQLESESSQIYLKMACWADSQGYRGMATYMFKASDEERAHMLKLIHYLLDRGGKVTGADYSSPKNMFQTSLEHERTVSAAIIKLAKKADTSGDLMTREYLHWFILEQIEEEDKVMSLLDELKIIGDDKGGLYSFDEKLKD